MLTAGQARQDPAINRAAALQPADPRILEVINRAQRFILGHGGYADAEQEYCFKISNGCIFVPPEIRAILDVQIMGGHAEMFDKTFFYLDNGPRSPQGSGLGLVDRGPVSIFTQPTCPTGLMVIADACEKQTPVPWVSIVAKDQAGRRIVTKDEASGELFQSIRLPLVNGKVFRYPTANVMTVEQITKPPTLGAVHVFQYDPACDNVGPLVASLAPHDTSPSWRKYEVAGGPVSGRVRVLARRQHTPIYHDDQPLIVDDAETLAYAILHVQSLDGGAFDSAKEYLAAMERRIKTRDDELHKGDERRIEFHMPTRPTSFPRLR